VSASAPVVPASVPVAAPIVAGTEVEAALGTLAEAATRPSDDAAADQANQAASYRGVPAELTPTERYQALSDLVRTTHATTPGYRPMVELYHLVDLHPDLKLHAIYSDRLIEPAAVILEDFRVEAERAARLATAGPETVDALEAELAFNSSSARTDRSTATSEFAYPTTHTILALRSWFAPAHRSQSRPQAAMIGLDPAVGVRLGAVPRRRQRLVEHGEVGRCVVGDHLHGRDLRDADGPFEQSVGRRRVPPHGDEHVDDLPELVDGAVDVAPPAGDLHVGLVDEPATSDGVPAGAGAWTRSGVSCWTQRSTLTWSTSTPRSASSCSTSRSDRPKRRF
jgi:hypothetical protein